jgi:hypothetical protein
MTHLFLRQARVRSFLCCLLLLLPYFSNGQTVQLGATGTPPSSQANFYDGIPSPAYSAKTNARVQLFYSKAELNALGMTGAQIIDSFSYYVFTLPAGSFLNYTVRMKSAPDDFDNYDPLAGFYEVYTNVGYTANAGWNKFTLQTPFYWNGNDNIVIDFCWTNSATQVETGGVWVDVGANHENINYFLDDVIPACKNLASHESGSGIANFRPVLRLSYHVPAACTGTPVAVVSPSGISQVVPGCSQRLEATGNALLSGLSYQWEISTNGGSNWSPVMGASYSVYEFYPLSNALYRVIAGCGGNTTTSAAVTVNLSQPTPAVLPYFQDFESWTNGCMGLKELPDNHWAGIPSVGLSSWRREDEGLWAGWKYIVWGDGDFLPSSVGGSHAARFHSWGASPTVPGIMDLYLDCSGGAAGKALYFYYNDSATNNFWNTPVSFLVQPEDSLIIKLSTDGGQTFSTLAEMTDAADPGWKRMHIPFNSTSANTVIRFYASWNSSTLQPLTDIGIDSVYVANSCSGTPFAGVIQDDEIISCSAVTKILTSTGTSLAGGLDYQWQESADGVIWNNTSGGGGANTLTYTTSNLTDTTYFRLIVTCQNTSQSDTTNTAVVLVPSPIYATLPYTEGFESWADYCGLKDRPAPYWLNTPASTNYSWRRNDEGYTANWLGGPGLYTYNYHGPSGNYYSASHSNPVAIEGDHFARNHSGSYGFEAALWLYLGLPGEYPDLGTMNLYLDCSAPGTKELSFFYNNQGIGLNAPIDDSLHIFLSTDGGNSFDPIWSNADINPLWNYQTIQFNSTAANTIIRFRSSADFEDGDMGIDKLQVAGLCSGQPDAGTVDSVTVLYTCPNDTFYVRLRENTVAGGLFYEWQTSPNGSAWTSVPSGNTPVLASSLTADTWYRCIVTCIGSGMGDTTAAQLIKKAPSYYCYCSSAAENSLNSAINIGNVLLIDTVMQATVLDNGIATPYTMNPGPYNFYTDFRGMAPAALAQGSDYQLNITTKAMDGGGIASGADPAATAYIDFNANGIYEPIEQVFFATVPQIVSMNASGTPIVAYFTVPSNAVLGITGMRIIMDAMGAASDAPCGYFPNGETEDYVVTIDYPKCTGVPQAGTAYITDTLVNPGSSVIVFDTSYQEEATGLYWFWQLSVDGSNWTDIPGSEMQDSITANITAPTYFRMVVVCEPSEDTAASNIVTVKTNSIRSLSPTEGSISIFPNPSDGRVWLSFEGRDQEEMELIMMDAVGHELSRTTLKNIRDGYKVEIDLSRYAKGIYIIRAEFTNGSLSKNIILK